MKTFVGDARLCHCGCGQESVVIDAQGEDRWLVAWRVTRAGEMHWVESVFADSEYGIHRAHPDPDAVLARYTAWRLTHHE